MSKVMKMVEVEMEINEDNAFDVITNRGNI